MNIVTFQFAIDDDFFELTKIYEIDWEKYPSIEEQVILLIEPIVLTTQIERLKKLTKYVRFDGILRTTNPEHYFGSGIVIFAAIAKDGGINEFLKIPYEIIKYMIGRGCIRPADKIT